MTKDDYVSDLMPRIRKPDVNATQASRSMPSTQTTAAENPSSDVSALTLMTQIAVLMMAPTTVRKMRIRAAICNLRGLSTTRERIASRPSIATSNKPMGYTVAIRIAPCSLIMRSSVAGGA